MSQKYYVGVATNTRTDEYYIFKRTCPKNSTPERDVYWGSGIWPRSYTRTYKHKHFKVEILKIFSAEIEALHYELDVIQEYFDDPLCMNERREIHGVFSTKAIEKMKKASKKRWSKQEERDKLSRNNKNNVPLIIDGIEYYNKRHACDTLKIPYGSLKKVVGSRKNTYTRRSDKKVFSVEYPD